MFTWFDKLFGEGYLTRGDKLYKGNFDLLFMWAKASLDKAHFSSYV